MHTDTNIFYILKLVIHRLLKGCRAETYSYWHHNVTYYISVENAEYLSWNMSSFVLHHHQTSYTGISSYKHVHALGTFYINTTGSCSLGSLCCYSKPDLFKSFCCNWDLVLLLVPSSTWMMIMQRTCTAENTTDHVIRGIYANCVASEL